jgi:hypothetical protein
MKNSQTNYTIRKMKPKQTHKHTHTHTHTHTDERACAYTAELVQHQSSYLPVRLFRLLDGKDMIEINEELYKTDRTNQSISLFVSSTNAKIRHS